MVPVPNQYKHLYNKLLNGDLKNEVGLHPFFCQAGDKYLNTGKILLFIGKSVNGWVTESKDVNELFDPQNENRIVNRDDQLVWVKNHEGSKEGYNTNRSAFWRVIKAISKEITHTNEWYRYVAWSNLYKASPKDGLPSKSLRKKQLETCKDILLLDFDSLKPDCVVFLTSNWEDSFLPIGGYTNDRNQCQEWDNQKYQTCYGRCNGRLMIHSQAPGGKKEQEHADAIVEIIKKNVTKVGSRAI